MLKILGTKSAFLVFAVAAAAFSFAPVTQATPINYDFTVSVSTGPLFGTTANGSFSYDSSSVVAGGTNSAPRLLTALDFTFDNITYDASTANTGFLEFDFDGNLINILFGTNCIGMRCTLPSPASWQSRSGVFSYGALAANGSYKSGAGFLSYALATTEPVAVPEPGSLGLFGLGALMLGAFVGLRRRIC